MKDLQNLQLLTGWMGVDTGAESLLGPVWMAQKYSPSPPVLDHAPLYSPLYGGA